MASVFCSRDVSFQLKEEETEVLQKAHDILENIRYMWNIQDDNAWDNEDYWEIENAVSMLRKQFKCSKKK